MRFHTSTFDILRFAFNYRLIGGFGAPQCPLSLYHQRALHVLMTVAADGIAGEGKDAGLVGFKRHVRGLSGLNPIG